MDKNTIWAIVLSSIVLFATFFIQNKYFAPQPAESAAVGTETASQTESLQNTASSDVLLRVSRKLPMQVRNLKKFLKKKNILSKRTPSRYVLQTAAAIL